MNLENESIGFKPRPHTKDMSGCALYTAKKSTVHLGALAEKLGWLGWTKVRGQI